MLQNGIAAAFAKKCFVAYQHVRRLQLARFEFREKRSAWPKARISYSPPSIRLQDIGDQGMREIPR